MFVFIDPILVTGTAGSAVEDLRTLKTFPNQITCQLDNVYINGRYTRAEYIEQHEKLVDELNRLVGPDNMVAVERGFVLETFGSYLEKATANELSDICRAVLDAVYTDFVNSRITRFKPAIEFMDLFRIAAPLSGWEEREGGSFIVQTIDDNGKR